jgi:hypothetical protein
VQVVDKMEQLFDVWEVFWRVSLAGMLALTPGMFFWLVVVGLSVSMWSIAQKMGV